MVRLNSLRQDVLEADFNTAVTYHAESFEWTSCPPDCMDAKRIDTLRAELVRRIKHRQANAAQLQTNLVERRGTGVGFAGAQRWQDGDDMRSPLDFFNR